MQEMYPRDAELLIYDSDEQFEEAQKIDLDGVNIRELLQDGGPVLEHTVVNMWIYSYSGDMMRQNATGYFAQTLTPYGRCFTSQINLTVGRSSIDNGIRLVLDVNSDDYYVSLANSMALGFVVSHLCLLLQKRREHLWKYVSECRVLDRETSQAIEYVKRASLCTHGADLAIGDCLQLPLLSQSQGQWQAVKENSSGSITAIAFTMIATISTIVEPLQSLLEHIKEVDSDHDRNGCNDHNNRCKRRNDHWNITKK